MPSRLPALFVLLLLGLWAAPIAAAPPSVEPESALMAGRVAYERGDYAQAIATLHPLLYPRIELDSEDAVFEAHRLLALSYFFVRKEKEAEEEAASLLALRPSYEPDPVVDPPVAVRFFQDVRRKQDDRLQRIRERQRQEEERTRREEERRAIAARARAERIYVERAVTRNSRLYALIPFGVGQVQNGSRRLGILFAVSEAVLGALSIASWAALQIKFPERRFAPDQRTLAEGLLGLQLASGAAFWAMALSGIVEAQVRFVPERVVRAREIKGPPAAPLSLSPIIQPGQLYGLGLSGGF